MELVAQFGQNLFKSVKLYTRRGHTHNYPVRGSVFDAVSLLFFLPHKKKTPRFCVCRKVL